MAVSCDMVRDPDHRKLFRFERFNAVQSLCFDEVYNSDQNLVISAPSGSGKTVSSGVQVLLELAILRLLEQSASRVLPEQHTVLCVCPTKALCSERAIEQLRLACDTFETSLTLPTVIAATDILVTTRERYQCNPSSGGQSMQSCMQPRIWTWPHVCWDIRKSYCLPWENIKVLCTTSTSAQGISLPARLCVVKSTIAYKEGKYSEYDEIEMLQMIRRAGRANIDTCGVAVIMSPHDSYAKWNELTSGHQRICSKLPEEFAEHLATEVALGTVQNSADASAWLDATFWGVQVPFESIQAARDFITFQLDKLNLEAFEKLPVDDLLRSLMQLVASAYEFEDFAPRREHKKPLRESSNHPRMKWRLKHCAINAKEKAFVLMQAAIFGIRIDQVMCLQECALARNLGRTYCCVQTLARSLRKRIAWETPEQLTQLPGTANASCALLPGLNWPSRVALDLLVTEAAHFQSLQRLCAALPRFIVALHSRGDLAKISLLSFNLRKGQEGVCGAFEAPEICYQIVCYSEKGEIQFVRRLMPPRLNSQLELFFRINNARRIVCRVVGATAVAVLSPLLCFSAPSVPDLPGIRGVGRQGGGACAGCADSRCYPRVFVPAAEGCTPAASASNASATFYAHSAESGSQDSGRGMEKFAFPDGSLPAKGRRPCREHVGGGTTATSSVFEHNWSELAGSSKRRKNAAKGREAAGKSNNKTQRKVLPRSFASLRVTATGESACKKSKRHTENCVAAMAEAN
ncbi:uncharacterized protein LOC113146931 [Cyclospora cayetanensis]|uniref:Uncharacterized protein LOC113146931 n=1 Tax=Cyclospora cayetanensis TaxID=88456 RepID=A0A6P6RUM1_9EIME|nr:uncharacterized protein LOC113146931 [Cyclospora cayetanensis]